MTTPASNVPELAPVSQPPLDVIVLAAGQGTRMRSALPKVLHPVMGRPMVSWAVKRARELGARDVVVVTGHGADRVEAALAGDGVRFARQDRQLGTGHAFLVGARTLAGDGDVLVLYGDTPLLTPETLRALLNDHRERGSALTVLTGELEDATGYGRILRDADGSVSRIVEEKAATPDEKRVREFNSGVYLMNRRAPELAERITDDNAAGEYYLTDLLALYRAEGARVSAFRLADADEVMGANDRVQLAQAEAIMRRRLAESFMRAGVTLIDPATTYIEDSVELAQDCVLEPGVILRGETRVARGATIGAYSVVTDSTVAEDAEIKPHSVLEGVTVGPRSHVGPFARLRGGAVLAEDVHVGNFVEIKNSTLARGVKAGHLAYLGDAEVGEDSNIGAGTITANFDGVDKHRTRIGRGVFIGSNSTLIAPRTLGDAAYVAAGSTVHDDVAEGALAVARGRQRNVEGWSLRNWRRVSERLQGRNVFLTTWLDAQRSRSE